MIRTASKLSIVALLALSMACGGETENNSNNSNNTNNATPDTGDNNGTDAGTDANNDTPDVGDDAGETTGPEDRTAPKCTDAAPPADCAADPATKTDWAPSSVADNLTLVGSNDECCYDFDQDSLGIQDNALGQILSLADGDGELQGSLDDAIGNGDVVLVMAHIGLDAADNDDEFTVGFMLGEPAPGWVDTNTDDAYEFQPDPAGGNPYLINADSFEAGAYPQAAALASLDNGEVTAGPGRITLQLELFGITLALGVSQVRIVADVGANSNLTDGTGVQLEDGTLAGIVKITEVFDAVNDFTETNCGCLGYTGDFIPYSSAASLDLAACTDTLDKDAAATNCPEDPDAPDDVNGLCVTVATTVCENLGAIGFALDQYTDEPLRNCIESSGADAVDCDGISLGLRFTAAGAKIEGVAAE